MALKGKNVNIEVSPDDNTYYLVQELNEASMSFEGENIDVTSFCSSFINRIQGLKDNTFDLSGFYAPDDTTGQVLIRDAWENDDDLWIRYIVDKNTGEGFKQQVRVSSFEVSATVEDAVEVSIDLEGTGPLTAIET